MITTLEVLSLGSLNSSNFVRDIILSRTKCRLAAATCVWDLSVILASGKVDVAILHGTLSPGELRSCATYFHHHWPAARILLILAQVEILDDHPMYDERVPPNSPAETLLSMIERFAASSRRSERSALNDGRNQH